jgi:hypothetical protein
MGAETREMEDLKAYLWAEHEEIFLTNDRGRI